MMGIVAALDGGGTKTELVWADAAGQTGRCRIASGCNAQDNPDWLTPLRAVFSALPAPPLHSVLGLPGYDEVPELDRHITTEILALCPGPATLLNDVALACHGAFPQGGGVLVLAGTGSMAMARGPKGIRRCGGWGDAYGDEGSAHWIGREALSLASQMLDGRLPSSGFDRDLCARLDVSAGDGGFALMARVQSVASPRATVASVAAHVDALAEQDSPDARRILGVAADHLHRHATAAAQAAGLAAPWPWACAGSVFRSRFVVDTLQRRIGHPAMTPQHSALVCGLILAARAADWPATHPWITRITLGLAAFAAQQDRP